MHIYILKLLHFYKHSAAFLNFVNRLIQKWNCNNWRLLLDTLSWKTTQSKIRALFNILRETDKANEGSALESVCYHVRNPRVIRFG